MVQPLPSGELAQLLEKAKDAVVKHVSGKAKKGEVVDLSVSISVAEREGYTFDVDVKLTVRPSSTLNVEALVNEAADKALSVIDRYFKRIGSTKAGSADRKC